MRLMSQGACQPPAAIPYTLTATPYVSSPRAAQRQLDDRSQPVHVGPGELLDKVVVRPRLLRQSHSGRAAARQEAVGDVAVAAAVDGVVDRQAYSHVPRAALHAFQAGTNPISVA